MFLLKFSLLLHFTLRLAIKNNAYLSHEYLLPRTLTCAASIVIAAVSWLLAKCCENILQLFQQTKNNFFALTMHIYYKKIAILCYIVLPQFLLISQFFGALVGACVCVCAPTLHFLQHDIIFTANNVRFFILLTTTITKEKDVPL